MSDNNNNCQKIEDCSSCSSCSSCFYCFYCSYCSSCSYCYYSKNLRMSENMLFCLGKDKYAQEGDGCQKNYRIFNQDVSKDEWNKIKNSLPSIELPLTHWIEEKEMSAEEKKNNKIYKEIGGYLKVLSYEDAWKEWWNSASQEDKDKILNIPQFDKEIFLGITGLDVVKDNLVGSIATVEIGGKTYKAKIIEDTK